MTNEKGMDSGSAHIQSVNAGMTGNNFVEPHIRWRGEGRHEEPAPTGNGDREEHPHSDPLMPRRIIDPTRRVRTTHGVGPETPPIPLLRPFDPAQGERNTLPLGMERLYFGSMPTRGMPVMQRSH